MKMTPISLSRKCSNIRHLLRMWFWFYRYLIGVVYYRPFRGHFCVPLVMMKSICAAVGGTIALSNPIFYPSFPYKNNNFCV